MLQLIVDDIQTDWQSDRHEKNYKPDHSILGKKIPEFS